MKATVLNRFPTAAVSLGANALGLKYRLKRYSSEMYSVMQEWKDIETLPVEIIRERQLLRLRYILDVASHTPFYARRFQESHFHPNDITKLEDLSLLPVLTRDDVKDNFDEMIVTNNSTKTIKRKSSGTTGAPLEYIQPASLVFTKAYAALYQVYSWVGVPPLARRATLAGRYMGNKPNGVIIQNYFERQLLLGVHSLTDSTVSNYIDALKKFSPQILQAHPSALLQLMDYSISLGLEPPQIPVIAYTGETLSENDRLRFMDWSQGIVFGQYGAGEHHIFTSECSELDGYHINPDYGYTELMQTELGGQIVSTSLINDAMPLIRYRIGDLAEEIDESVCNCGRTWPRIKGLRGRTDDNLTAIDGRMIPSVVFRTGLAATFKNLPPYTIIQHTCSGFFTFRVCSSADPEHFIQVKGYLEKLLGEGSNVQVTTVPYNEVLTTRGKHRTVIRE